MDQGVLALILAPFLALAGVVIGKIIDKRASDGKHATDLIAALQAEIVRRDKAADRLSAAYRVLEDYATRLRRTIMGTGNDPEPWPPGLAGEKETASP
jgi:hypothetical protein